MNIEEFKTQQEMDVMIQKESSTENVRTKKGHSNVKTKTKRSLNKPTTTASIGKNSMTWKIMKAIRLSEKNEASLQFIKKEILKENPNLYNSTRNKRFKNALKKIIDSGLGEMVNRARVRLLGSGRNTTSKNKCVNSQKILKFIKQEQTCTRQHITKHFGISSSVVTDILKKLEIEGSISRINKHTFIVTEKKKSAQMKRPKNGKSGKTQTKFKLAMKKAMRKFFKSMEDAIASL